MSVSVKVSTTRPTEAAADALAIGVPENADATGAPLADVDAAAGEVIARVLRTGSFKGKFKDTLVLYPPGLAAPRLILVGLGDLKALTPDRVRQLGARVAKTARDAGAAHVAAPIVATGSDVTTEEAARAFTEGALLAMWRFTRYKSEVPSDRTDLAKVTLLASNATTARVAKRGAAAGVAVADSVNLTRDWATVSGEEAEPPTLAKDAATTLRKVGLKVQVCDQARIERLNMGGVLAVNRGSVTEPRFLVIEHGREHANKKGTLVLVGKGVVFDTGGISIKPSDKMEDMKFDKGGAAAVWGAMHAIAKLKIPVHIVALTPVVTNMPSATAIKPGDVYTALDGTTVEVINTDAEGRMILGDALAYAARHDPSAIIDVATLTGHVIIAFGHLASGIMGNDRDLLDRVKAAAEVANEPVGEMPFLDGYGEMVEGRYGDIKNSAGRPAGAITAGKFLERFVPEGVPWVHMDIAGTAWSEGGTPGFNTEYSPAQATGVAVRTFVALAEKWTRPRGR